MKLYKGLVAATVEALQHIFVKNRQADRVVEQLLKTNKKWGARDRAFIAGNTYEIVRWWRLIKFAADIERVSEPEEFWKIVGTWQIIKPVHLITEEDGNLPEWPEFEDIDAVNVVSRYHEGLSVRKIAQSIPDWIDAIGAEELGEAWDVEIEALNEQAPVVIRVNTLKSNVQTVREGFGEDGAAEIVGIPNALVLRKRQNVLNQEAFKQGFFEVQDAGSQLIAPYLDIQPGHSVIDACAGAGGKTLHIAALLQNEGSILAMDIEHHKLVELEKRAARNGVKNLETMLISSDKIIESLAGTADRLLLDVPCSGLGVLRRNPDSKWKLKPQFLDEIRKVQWQILTHYSRMVKTGGKMVYATCSVLPSESEDQVKRFMKANKKDWKFISAHRASVAKDGTDGFYMALMQRK
ncbi:RsmB/NOP family class I SAM-dependent RNA methyltransferase [Dyadobacter fanqingshengii]|uniref:Class I SAM-dependent methyltransferase n=1 Tax=Dyadobacter fanqingshengii TaxID=2906443 RepID=A0A9X1TGY7_9BACT|nr:class I SAM-dependent methyltransferase [Dyadobacter fanqingshengii]MCF0041017.1 class I SAM-dependent methyltransferase [Dyadobacter fanqingshengii]USJ37252.1 class I SAM-dependent methyltransferase [Dyadobacter fanqingshengii]